MRRPGCNAGPLGLYERPRRAGPAESRPDQDAQAHHRLVAPAPATPAKYHTDDRATAEAAEDQRNRLLTISPRFADEVRQSTEWQQAPCRGFLSNAAKKRGLNIESTMNDSGDRVYPRGREVARRNAPVNGLNEHVEEKVSRHSITTAMPFASSLPEGNLRHRAGPAMGIALFFAAASNLRGELKVVESVVRREMAYCSGYSG